jgi:hypothetical protein
VRLLDSNPFRDRQNVYFESKQDFAVICTGKKWNPDVASLFSVVLNSLISDQTPLIFVVSIDVDLLVVLINSF